MDASSIALTGMANSYQKASEASLNIAKGATASTDKSQQSIESSMVDLSQAELVYQANAKVFKAADEMKGTLLDMKV